MIMKEKGGRRLSTEQEKGRGARRLGGI